jgi:hypothetical protein
MACSERGRLGAHFVGAFDARYVDLVRGSRVQRHHLGERAWRATAGEVSGRLIIAAPQADAMTARFRACRDLGMLDSQRRRLPAFNESGHIPLPSISLPSELAADMSTRLIELQLAALRVMVPRVLAALIVGEDSADSILSDEAMASALASVGETAGDRSFALNYVRGMHSEVTALIQEIAAAKEARASAPALAFARNGDAEGQECGSPTAT